MSSSISQMMTGSPEEIKKIFYFFRAHIIYFIFGAQMDIVLQLFPVRFIFFNKDFFSQENHLNTIVTNFNTRKKEEN